MARQLPVNNGQQEKDKEKRKASGCSLLLQTLPAASIWERAEVNRGDMPAGRARVHRPACTSSAQEAHTFLHRPAGSTGPPQPALFCYGLPRVAKPRSHSHLDSERAGQELSLPHPPKDTQKQLKKQEAVTGDRKLQLQTLLGLFLRLRRVVEVAHIPTTGTVKENLPRPCSRNTVNRKEGILSTETVCERKAYSQTHSASIQHQR